MEPIKATCGVLKEVEKYLTLEPKNGFLTFFYTIMIDPEMKKDTFEYKL